jgi:hypothetical protein
MHITARHRGIFFDRDCFDHELAIKGLSARRLAEKAGIGESIISRARHGYAISPTTARRITAALLKEPTVDGLEVLVARPARGEPE